MNHCESHIALTKTVKEFLHYVPNANEESITDFLIWQWGVIAKRYGLIKFSSLKTSTKQRESQTGVDFEMEVWLVGKKLSYPLVFQAKKLVKQHNAYRNKLRYPQDTQDQMNKLLKHAKAEKKMPFYAFYNGFDDDDQATRLYDNNCGVFMARAEVVKDFADKKQGSKVSKNDLLAESMPFYCMFCCLVGCREYIKKHFSSIDIEFGRSERPKYVDHILTHQNEINVPENKEETEQLIEKYNLRQFRHIVVCDIRGIDTTCENEIDEDRNDRIKKYINKINDEFFNKLFNK